MLIDYDFVFACIYWVENLITHWPISVLGHYESLQDKLAQLRDAREALDALREDYREKKRREQEELERQRQIQMAHKLEIMRQKKHVSLLQINCI